METKGSFLIYLQPLSLFSTENTYAPTALDVDTARRSLKKYNAFDISSVICYHGGISTENIREQIRAL